MREKTVEEIMSSLTEDQIKEFMDDYKLSYEEAKKGLAEYIHFNLYNEDYEVNSISSKRIGRK